LLQFLAKFIRFSLSFSLFRYLYKLAREYNWNVKNKAIKGFEVYKDSFIDCGINPHVVLKNKNLFSFSVPLGGVYT